MTNRPPQPSATKRERFQSAPERPPFSSLLAELKSLGERGSRVLGGAYALAAGSVLHGLERLEDLNAERDHQQRARSLPAAGEQRVPSLTAPRASRVPSTK